MEKYRCQVCGYIYDSETGDLAEGIEAGTEFHDIDEEWLCPVCGAGKDEFFLV